MAALYRPEAIARRQNHRVEKVTLPDVRLVGLLVTLLVMAFVSLFVFYTRTVAAPDAATQGSQQPEKRS